MDNSFTGEPGKWWWESGGDFRLAAIRPDRGDVSLVAGGASLTGDDWPNAYHALTEELRAASSWASYGLIKQGRRVSQVGRSLIYDWLPAFHYGTYGLDHSVYEDVLAPDAFGAQLLGAGYRGRVPRGQDWEQ